MVLEVKGDYSTMAGQDKAGIWKCPTTMGGPPADYASDNTLVKIEHSLG